MSGPIKKLNKEYKELLEEKDSLNVFAEPNKDEIINKEGNIETKLNMYEWTGYIIGPSDSPYEGGKFMIKILFPTEYPYKPPMINFITRIYHPNINKNGNICLDILKDAWSPALSIKKVLLSISTLLEINTINPHDPLEGDIADVFIKDIKKFISNAKLWTKKYAIIS